MCVLGQEGRSTGVKSCDRGLTKFYQVQVEVKVMRLYQQLWLGGYYTAATGRGIYRKDLGRGEVLCLGAGEDEGSGVGGRALPRTRTPPHSTPTMLVPCFFCLQ